MSIGKKLATLRGKKSMPEVAESLGVSLSAYVKYERNERVPRDEIKVKIANYYGKTVQEIFFN